VSVFYDPLSATGDDPDHPIRKHVENVWAGGGFIRDFSDEAKRGNEFRQSVVGDKDG